MAIDYSGKTIVELNTIVANGRRRNETNHPRYLAAGEELKRRDPPLLEPAKSRSIILSAAREGRFLNYGQLAEASGIKWSPVVRRQMQKHLGDLVSHAHDRGWPMLTAIVVNKANLISGEMDAGTLKGFIRAAEDLGRQDIDPIHAEFLKKEQARLFAYAKDHPNI